MCGKIVISLFFINSILSWFFSKTLLGTIHHICYILLSLTNIGILPGGGDSVVVEVEGVGVVVVEVVVVEIVVVVSGGPVVSSVVSNEKIRLLYPLI